MGLDISPLSFSEVNMAVYSVSWMGQKVSPTAALDPLSKITKKPRIGYVAEAGSKNRQAKQGK